MASMPWVCWFRFGVVTIGRWGAVQTAASVLPWDSAWGRWMSVFNVYASRMSFRSRSGFARPNSCILRALILLTVPSTAPEL